jgi:hypothetical protein
MSALLAIARAIWTNCWRAVLNAPIGTSGSIVSSMSARCSTAARRVAFQSMPKEPYAWLPSMTFSVTVRSGQSVSSCGAMAMPARWASEGAARRSGLPSRRRMPSSGASLPHKMLMSVDFPAPFSPITAWTSAGRSPMLTRSTARSAPKRLERSRASSA